MMIYPVMSFDTYLIAGSQLSTQNYNSLYIKILVYIDLGVKSCYLGAIC